MSEINKTTWHAINSARESAINSAQYSKRSDFESWLTIAGLWERIEFTTYEIKNGR